MFRISKIKLGRSILSSYTVMNSSGHFFKFVPRLMIECESKCPGCVNHLLQERLMAMTIINHYLLCCYSGPLNNRCIGTSNFVLCKEIVLFSEVNNIWCKKSVLCIGRLSSTQRVHYQRFH